MNEDNVVCRRDYSRYCDGRSIHHSTPSVMAESTYVRADGEREDRTIRAAGLQEVNLKKN